MKIKQYKNAKKNTFLKYKIIAVVFVALICLGLYGVNKASDYVATWEESIKQEGFETGHLLGLTEGYNAAKEEDWSMLNTNPEIVALLKKHFPEYSDARTANAIIQAESKFKADAKNYNCYYTDKQGKKYSTQCKKGDEHKAWSVDCGAAQLNYHGKVCPAWTFDIDKNLEKMKSMKEKRGWTPWVTYNRNLHLTYMK